MFYYIDQPRTPSFPIGVVKSESDFIVRDHLRLAEGDERWW